MALYAYDEGVPIFAANAVVAKHYQCAGCGGKVKVRKGVERIPHFYHVADATSCGLGGKSQSHMRAQLTIQELLPVGEAVLERPFNSISRIADVAWEPQKIVFEIQCSQLPQKEAEARVRDYGTAGYTVAWILDDQLFNKRLIGTSERWIRERLSYYVDLAKRFPIFYDQFELLRGALRVKKGARLPVQLARPSLVPEVAWPKGQIPNQVLRKATFTQRFFEGDLFHKALLSLSDPALATSMQNLRMQEPAHEAPQVQQNSILQKILWAIRSILRPLLKKASKPL